MPSQATSASAFSSLPAGSETEWECVPSDDEHDLAREERVLKRWARFYRQFKAIRRLQRLFAYVGKHLQTISPALRDRLTKYWPAGRH